MIDENKTDNESIMDKCNDGYSDCLCKDRCSGNKFF